jgi:hypothetical protein
MIPDLCSESGAVSPVEAQPTLFAESIHAPARSQKINADSVDPMTWKLQALRRIALRYLSTLAVRRN